MAELKLKERHKEWAIFGAVAVICAFSAFSVLITPALNKSRELRNGIETSQKRIELHQSIVNLRAELKDLESSFATMADRPILTGRVSDLASKSRIEVSGVSPKDIVQVPYNKFLLEVDMKSSFSTLLKYLATIETMSPVFNVNDLTITRSFNISKGQKDLRPLQCKLVLETLLKQKAH